MITIEWGSSKEFISIDLKSAYTAAPRISRTSEYWPPTETIEYNTQSRWRVLQDGTLELAITYQREKNPHLVLFEDRIAWGTSTIFLPPGATTGELIWKGLEDSSHDGPRRWNLVSDELFRKPSRELVTRQKRRQSKFKAELLALEAKCALSGDQTVEVLDAAHIIHCKNGGNEVVANGLLLRADLHRLFDAKLFSFSPCGHVIINRSEQTKLSTFYLEMLSGARLETKVIKRVEKALRHVRRPRP